MQNLDGIQFGQHPSLTVPNLDGTEVWMSSNRRRAETKRTVTLESRHNHVCRNSLVAECTERVPNLFQISDCVQQGREQRQIKETRRRKSSSRSLLGLLLSGQVWSCSLGSKNGSSGGKQEFNGGKGIYVATIFCLFASVFLFLLSESCQHL